MREIKFRAWLDDGEDQGMLPVSKISWEPGKVFIECPIATPGGKVSCRVIERKSHKTILMQYTGLKDKNGMEIYEGDIVKCVPNDWSELLAEPPDLTRDASTIEYFHGMFHLCQKYHGREPIEDYLDSGYDDERAFIEVIGNIHENPDLLDAKDVAKALSDGTASEHE